MKILPSKDIKQPESAIEIVKLCNLNKENFEFQIHWLIDKKQDKYGKYSPTTTFLFCKN